MDNSYGLLKVQEANLELLSEIDRICTKYKIPYMLDAGTLLGAIRHGGFIPWDDDADIAMTRKSFEAFKKACSRELDEDMSLLLPDDLRGGKAFYDFTPRLIHNKSRRHEPDAESAYYEEKLNHLWVDIFILDVLPEGRIAAGFARNAQKFAYLLAMGHRYKIDYGKYSLIHRLLIRIFSGIGKRISMRRIFRLQERFAGMWSKSRSRRVFYSNYQPDYLYVTLKRDWIKNLIRIKFEETELSISESCDDILRWVYGDYMKLPPKEERKPSHGSREIVIYE